MASTQDWSGRRLHFVGIGGAGMSGLALVARELGASVTGSDRAESPYLVPLRAAGIDPAIGHAAENVPDGAELVFSTAIPAENPERAAARERGLTERHRGELLAEMAGLKRCIAVTGTHGKTTTAAMLVHVLAGCGMDPAFLVGGEIAAPGGRRANAGWGEGEWIVVEADESDRSLLAIAPEIAVLTNAELDHHTTYGSRLDLEQTLRTFLERAPHAVVWDRPELLELAAGRDVVPFDVPEPELPAEGSRFQWQGIEVRLGVPGEHNALNAAAALAAAELAGADPRAAAEALRTFRGVARRFERIGRTATGAEVYDDYAHHPTEVRETLQAARTLGPRRLLAVFQPHLFSRTAALWREFGAALALADLPLVVEVYPARERAEDWPGVTGRLVAEAAADAGGGRAVGWFPGLDDAERFLRGELREGDLCITLGAGDVDGLGRRLVDDPGAREAA
jgi:UDP-N-acetylmuramate--alanine ligase